VAKHQVRFGGDGALRLEVVAGADAERVDGGGRDERDQLDGAGRGQGQGPQLFVRDRDDPAVRQGVAAPCFSEGDFSELLLEIRRVVSLVGGLLPARACKRSEPSREDRRLF
jgi:hypothetical protein